jgi:hypothetical protein
MIEMTSVDSSSILEVGYDPGSAELHVRFKSSPSVYVYRGVSEEVFDRLMASPSKGTFINREIKNVYPFHVG